METLMVRTQVNLTQEQVVRVRRIATSRGSSMSTVIREAVDHWLQEEDTKVGRDWAIAAIGGFRSGHTNISERHDEHLAEHSSTPERHTFWESNVSEVGTQSTGSPAGEAVIQEAFAFDADFPAQGFRLVA
jgi:Arc/MetJ-type ribon-helix-helix transcriptional regulator